MSSPFALALCELALRVSGMSYRPQILYPHPALRIQQIREPTVGPTFHYRSGASALHRLDLNATLA